MDDQNNAQKTPKRNRARRTDLTAQRCRELFHYDRETGLLVWKITPCYTVSAGDVAGDKVKRGRRFAIRVAADGVRYMAHRVIWLWVTGEWPEQEVDHWDLDGTNNRWDNLRHATHSQNQRNRAANLNSTTGLKGAYFNKIGGKYYSHIRIDGKYKYLGSFNAAQAAHEAYRDAVKSYYGEFGRWQ